MVCEGGEEGGGADAMGIVGGLTLVGEGKGRLYVANGDIVVFPSQVRVSCVSHVFKGGNDPIPLSLRNTSHRFSTLTLPKSVPLGVTLHSVPQSNSKQTIKQSTVSPFVA